MPQRPIPQRSVPACRAAPRSPPPASESPICLVVAVPSPLRSPSLRSAAHSSPLPRRVTRRTTALHPTTAAGRRSYWPAARQGLPRAAAPPAKWTRRERPMSVGATRALVHVKHGQQGRSAPTLAMADAAGSTRRTEAEQRRRCCRQRKTLRTLRQRVQRALRQQSRQRSMSPPGPRSRRRHRPAPPKATCSWAGGGAPRAARPIHSRQRPDRG